jgi:hypothetical protein
LRLGGGAEHGAGSGEGHQENAALHGHGGFLWGVEGEDDETGL